MINYLKKMTRPDLYGGDQKGVLVYHLHHLYAGAGGYEAALCHGGNLLHASAQAYLHLSLAFARTGYAKVYCTHASHAVAYAKGTVALKLLHLPEHENEHGHKGAAAKDSHDGQKWAQGYGVPETYSSPSQSQEKVYQVTDGKELHGTTGVQCVTVGDVSSVGHGQVGIVVADANESQYHLDDENHRSGNGDGPVDTQRGV